MQQQDPHSKLIVALDVPDTKQAWEIVDDLGDLVDFYKIGMELIYQDGLEFARTLKKEGKKIFIDAKLHDIPRTVLSALKNIESLGADIVTIHTNMSCLNALEAYRKERGYANMKLCFISVLTSENLQDLRMMKQISDNANLKEHIVHLAKMVKKYSGDGLVASAFEVPLLRQALGDDFLIITPGIRPKGDWDTQWSGDKADDQKRSATPTRAIASGADYIVVGRPIVKADNRKLAAQTIINEIADAMEGNSQPLKLTNAIKINQPPEHGKKFTPVEAEDKDDALAIPRAIFNEASNILAEQSKANKVPAEQAETQKPVIKADIVRVTKSNNDKNIIKASPLYGAQKDSQDRESTPARTTAPIAPTRNKPVAKKHADVPNWQVVEPVKDKRPAPKENTPKWAPDKKDEDDEL